MNVRFLESRGFNQSTQVDLFIRLWDTPIDEVVSERLAILAPLQQISSPFGNMNNTGTPYPSTSCLASRFHPDFESVIEPGVKGLLFAIAIDHNLVTYTSCEGHDYRSDVVSRMSVTLGLSAAMETNTARWWRPSPRWHRASMQGTPRRRSRRR
ncbi:hypothetical protein [Stenotrophomonas hibiscicola]|uniref:hypothetical protein n=1 Tax=Stenotrophomonas hibiscicola TaxID=86189 RepID=UPI002E783167|nr:hypothetical protein [[Pseudomonas] hibiscicola]